MSNQLYYYSYKDYVPTLQAHYMMSDFRKKDIAKVMGWSNAKVSAVFSGGANLSGVDLMNLATILSIDIVHWAYESEYVYLQCRDIVSPFLREMIDKTCRRKWGDVDRKYGTTVVTESG